MKVCFVSQAFVRYEGDTIGSFIYRLAEETARRGIGVTAVVPHALSLRDAEILGRTSVARFRYAPDGYERLAYQGNMHSLVRASLLNKTLLLSFLAGSTRQAVATVRRENCDVIHAHWWFPSGLAGALAASITGVPLVITCHGTDVGLLGKQAVVDAVARRVFGKAAAVIAVSPYLERNVVRSLPHLDGHVTVIPMPVDRVFLETSAAGTATPAGPRRILAAGRLSKQKGFHHLISALGILQDRGVDARVLFVGEGEEEEALKAQAAGLGIQDRTEFAGSKTAVELAAYLRASDVAVLPSQDEGLGLTLVEAMFCGVPVVGSRSGGIVDVVEDGETGLLVTPGDAADLAAALQRVLTDRSLADRLGAAGRAAAQRKYDPDVCVDKVVAVYREVARRRT